MRNEADTLLEHEVQERPITALQAMQARAHVDALCSESFAAECLRLMKRGGTPLADMFERHAFRVFSDSDVGDALEYLKAAPVELVKNVRTDLYQVTTSVVADDMSQSAKSALEAAVNRLVLSTEALEEAAQRVAARRPADLSPAAHWGINRMGVGVLADDQPNAPSSSLLHASQMPERHHAGLFNELDWAVLDSVANQALRVFQGSLCPNEYQTVFGMCGTRGGEWDIRTRMASDLEHIRSPFGLRYAYDCDVRAQAASIRFIVPESAWFPATLYDRASHASRDVADERGAARAVFSLRLAGLLAAVCFGASARITQAHVTGFARAFEGDALFALVFDRRDYVYTTLQDIQSGRYSADEWRFDPAGFLSVLNPRRARIDIMEGRRALAPVEPFEDGMSAHRVMPAHDERPLPDRLAAFFHSRSVFDIETLHPHGDASAALVVEQAKHEASESPLAAIALLENLVDELKWERFPEDADARLLYCAHPPARALVSLLDDVFDVGAEAEEYLATGMLGLGHADDAPGERYVRCPDALYQAYVGLADLYRRVGDLAKAYAIADRCLALAPTTIVGYVRKAAILNDMGRHVEAANVLTASLEFAVIEADWTLVYYDLARTLWSMGEKSAALSVFSYLTYAHGDYAGKSRAALNSVRKREPDRYIPASMLEAVRIMGRSRIPIVPTDTAKHLVAVAAVGLANAGMPLAAAPYAELVADFSKGDPVLEAVYASLAHGTA